MAWRLTPRLPYATLKKYFLGKVESRGLTEVLGAARRRRVDWYANFGILAPKWRCVVELHSTKVFVGLALGMAGWGYLRALKTTWLPRAVAMRMREDVMGYF
jgi:hypothetical protein